MGRVAKRVQAEIERVASEVAERHETGAGDAAAQAVVVPYLETLRQRVETGLMSQATMLKGVLPLVWKEVGAAMETSATDARNRLFSFDRTTGSPLEIRQNFIEYRERESARDERTVVEKLSEGVRWNQSIYEELRDLFEGWLLGSDQGNLSENDRIVRLILAVSFFTGRRPWSEVATLGSFEVTTEAVLRDWAAPDRSHRDFETNFEVVETVIDFDSWADGWLQFEGAAKPAAKEKLLGRSLAIDIPVLGAGPEDVVEAMAELRHLQSDKSWFRSATTTDQEIVGSVLQANATKAIREEIEPILTPIYEAGMKLPDSSSGRFMPYHLRAMWGSRLHYEMGQARKEAGLPPMKDVLFAKYFLGHQGKFSRSTLAYLAWEYLGDTSL